MYQIVGPLKELFGLKSIKIEDILFRLHCFVTTPGLLFASLLGKKLDSYFNSFFMRRNILVTGQVHLGEPIQCSLFSFDSEKVI